MSPEYKARTKRLVSLLQIMSRVESCATNQSVQGREVCTNQSVQGREVCHQPISSGSRGVPPTNQFRVERCAPTNQFRVERCAPTNQFRVERCTPTNQSEMTVNWDVAPCSLVQVYRRFWGRPICCLHHQGDQLTAWSKALLKKPAVPQLVNNFTAFYSTRSFIAVFKTASYWAISRGVTVLRR
jgi:hypothetical protein